VKLAVKLATTFLFAGLSSLAADTAFAQQVGYPPSKSPYQDIDWSQHLTLFGGYYHAGKDDVGAMPGSAPMFGLRYEVDIAGPAQFYARVARVNSDRNTFDPTATTRALQAKGKVSNPLYLTDVGFSFNLTGRKSWHNIVPVVGFGIGIASAAKSSDAAAEKDPYRFGTQFLFDGQIGVRVIPSRRFELRFLLDNMWYQNHYPGSYFPTGTTDTVSVVGSEASKSSYKANFGLTAGISVPLFK
jgi:hypothetical protein